MKKLVTDFSKYTTVGIIVTTITISLTWFLIDITNIHTVLATSSVVVLAHLIKFYSYRKINLFDKQRIIHLQFTLFTVLVVFFSVLHIGLVWLLIDVLHISTFIGVAAVTVGLFFARFISFKFTRLIKDEK